MTTPCSRVRGLFALVTLGFEVEPPVGIEPTTFSLRFAADSNKPRRTLAELSVR
jgi:hypothetical protein